MILFHQLLKSTLRSSDPWLAWKRKAWKGRWLRQLDAGRSSDEMSTFTFYLFRSEHVIMRKSFSGVLFPANSMVVEEVTLKVFARMPMERRPQERVTRQKGCFIQKVEIWEKLRIVTSFQKGAGNSKERLFYWKVKNWNKLRQIKKKLRKKMRKWLGRDAVW